MTNESVFIGAPTGG